MRNFFLTLDFEEWYQLEYIKSLNPDKAIGVIPFIKCFLDELDRLKIKMTVFVIADLLDRYGDSIVDIANRGHEIALHGLNHDLLYEKSDNQFKDELVKAKNNLEKAINGPIYGYRAPCFSLDSKKLDILTECGFKYDSSYINFNKHPLYRKLDMSAFRKIQDLVYEKNGFYEIEVPTAKIFGQTFPISGGGYFRIIPWVVFKYLFSEYEKENNNFTFYIHPFELTGAVVPLPRGLSFGNKFRFSIGRKTNVERLLRFLELAKSKKYSFKSIHSFITAL